MIPEKVLRVIASLLLLLASTFILTFKIHVTQALSNFFKVEESERFTTKKTILSNNWRVNQGARDDLLADDFFSTNIINNKTTGLRAKSFNCGLWHPSIIEPKTW
jgi:hypothetical protein